MPEKLAIDGGEPIRKKFLPYGFHWIDEKDIKAVSDVLRTNLITQGPKVAEFERIVSKYCNSKYAVAFSSGTAALHAAAYTAGISNDDEVITTPLTFAADANSVLYVGGRVKFADIKTDTYNIDPELIEKFFTLQEETLIEQGRFPESLIEQQMSLMRKIVTPISLPLFGIFNYVVSGVLIALIASIFLKKEGDAFKKAMADVEEESAE